MSRPILARVLPLAFAALFASCAARDRDHTIRVSIADQKMVLFDKGVEMKRYDISTSRFGLGDLPGSRATPLGQLEIAEKIGGGQASGMKFKSRRPTGEIVAVNAPGRDPIVTRILWLRGLEPQNRHAYERKIYIHGTPEEWKMGTPASFGCIRMRSRDVMDLYGIVGKGARVDISREPLAPPSNPLPAAAPLMASHSPEPPPSAARP